MTLRVIVKASNWSRFLGMGGLRSI